MVERLLKVDGNDLYYVDYSEVGHSLTGTVVEGNMTPRFKVKDIYFYYRDYSDVVRRLLGTLTGEDMTAGRVKIKGDYIYYGDINNKERKLVFETEYNGWLGGIHGWTHDPDCPTWLTRYGSSLHLSGGTINELGAFVVRLLRHPDNCPGWWCAHMGRGVIYFNTSAIPPATVITSAKLKGRYHHTGDDLISGGTVVSGNVNFNDGSTLPNGPPPSSPPDAWFVTMKDCFDVKASLFVNKLVTSWTAFEIELLPEAVKKGEWTRLAIRGVYDTATPMGYQVWGVILDEIELVVGI